MAVMSYLWEQNMPQLRVIKGLLMHLPVSGCCSINPPLPESNDDYRSSLLTPSRSVIMTYQAIGACCIVAAGFDNNGHLDIVAASLNDNSISWFHNKGPDNITADNKNSSASLLLPTFSIKKQIIWSLLGSCIIIAPDIDSDVNMDMVGILYYDLSMWWFENDGSGNLCMIFSTINKE